MNTGVLRFPVHIPSSNSIIETAVNIATHPSQSGRILINIPGHDGRVDGYQNKYVDLANEITAQGIASVVRVDNTCWHPDIQQKAYSQFEYSLVESSVQHARENSNALCKSDNPTLYAAATSASTPFVLSLASKLNISKVLLMAPIDNLVPRSAILESLRQYAGDITIVYGADDSLINPEFIRFIEDSVNGNTTRIRIKVIENCDHQFSGERNRKQLQKIYINAFRDPQQRTNLRSFIRSKISPMTGIWPFARKD